MADIEILEDVLKFIDELPLPPLEDFQVSGKIQPLSLLPLEGSPVPKKPNEPTGAVNRGALEVFPENLPQQSIDDTADWTLLAQLGADKYATDHGFTRESEPVKWYAQYKKYLNMIGMTTISDEQFHITGDKISKSVANNIVQHMKPGLDSSSQALVQRLVDALGLSQHGPALDIFDKKAANAKAANTQLVGATVDSKLNLTIKTVHMTFDLKNPTMDRLLFWVFTNYNFTMAYRNTTLLLSITKANKLRDAVHKKVIDYYLGNIGDIPLPPIGEFA